jgi:hypothetical protein
LAVKELCGEGSVVHSLNERLVGERKGTGALMETIAGDVSLLYRLASTLRDCREGGGDAFPDEFVWWAAKADLNGWQRERIGKGKPERMATIDFVTELACAGMEKFLERPEFDDRDAAGMVGMLSASRASLSRVSGQVEGFAELDARAADCIQAIGAGTRSTGVWVEAAKALEGDRRKLLRMATVSDFSTAESGARVLSGEGRLNPLVREMVELRRSVKENVEARERRMDSGR